MEMEKWVLAQVNAASFLLIKVIFQIYVVQFY